MNIKVGILALAMASIGGTAMAQAGLPNPQRMDPSGGRTTADSEFRSIQNSEDRMKLLSDMPAQRTSWENATNFAACAVGLNSDRAEQLLQQSMPDLKAKRLTLSKFLDRNKGCIPTNAKIDPDFLRGALAQSLFTTSATAPEIPAGGDIAKVSPFIGKVAIGSAKQDDVFAKAQMEAECRVALQPLAARGLLASEAGSDGEAGALAALKAVTPQCDQIAPKQEITAYFTRAYTAQALYHWTKFKG